MNDSVFFLKDYGSVKIILKDILDMKEIARNKLSKLTGLSYNTINRYYKNAPITSVDLDILAKICFVLNCEISDLLKYEHHETQQDN